MMRYGGTGGPGNQAMLLPMQYGAPSQAGHYAANMAQFGTSSEGAGRIWPTAGPPGRRLT